MNKLNHIPEKSFSSGVSIVVFQKDAGEDLIRTLELLSEITTGKNSIELIVVDDASDNPPSLQSLKVFTSKVLYLDENIGISGAIAAGANMAIFDYLLAVPGTNMYTASAYNNVLNMYSAGYRIVLGHRTNLYPERPIAKFVASKLLLYAFRVATLKFRIQDIHGLNLFKTADLIRFLPTDGRHGGQMQLLAKVLIHKPSLIQVPTTLMSGHKHRQSATSKDSRPSINAVLKALKGISNVFISTLLRK